MYLLLTYLQGRIAHARIQRGMGQGSGPPLKNQKAIGFLSNTGPDPLKNHEVPGQHSLFDPKRSAS